MNQRTKINRNQNINSNDSEFLNWDKDVQFWYIQKLEEHQRYLIMLKDKGYTDNYLGYNLNEKIQQNQEEIIRMKSLLHN
jgi:hypothetical protein